jgi:poly-gamma-glutamate capsule biosynthesis protein CapA/YwtB (metallophosphatase superfamily)
MPRTFAALIALAVVVACGPRAAPAPVSVPAPPPVAAPTSRSTDSARASARAADSARAAARAVDSTRAAARADSARAVPRVLRPTPAAKPRMSARTDTIPTRVLRGPVRVCAGGDVTLGTNLDTAWTRVASARLRTRFGQRDDPATLLAPLRPLVSDAELVLVNVESAIGAGPAPSKCGPRSTNCFAFRAPPASAPALRGLRARGTVIGNLANNHARDAGSEGRDRTIAALERAGVVVTGVDTNATPVRTRAGDTIGVLGFYTSDSTPDARDTAAVRRLVARASERYPAVIVTMHLGAEGRDAQRTSDAEERYLGIDRGNPVAFADAAVRGGAALVIGHGPHVLRAVEWRERGALIAYSLGNLVTYGPFRLREPANRGAVLCATLDQRGRPRDAELRATRQLAPGVMRLDRSARAAALVDSLGRLDFPVTGARVRARGRLKPRTIPGEPPAHTAPR